MGTEPVTGGLPIRNTPVPGEKERGARHLSLILFFFLMFCLFVCLFFERERERENVNGGGAEKEGDTESEAGSRL